MPLSTYEDNMNRANKILRQQRREAMAEAERVTKPVTDASALRGQAKLAWFRKQIRARGTEPKGRTLAALNAEYKALG